MLVAADLIKEGTSPVLAANISALNGLVGETGVIPTETEVDAGLLESRDAIQQLGMAVAAGANVDDYVVTDFDFKSGQILRINYPTGKLIEQSMAVFISRSFRLKAEAIAAAHQKYSDAIEKS